MSKRLSIYYRVVLGILILWGTIFFLSIFTIWHVRRYQEQSTDRLWSCLRLATALSFSQEALSDLAGKATGAQDSVRSSLRDEVEKFRKNVRAVARNLQTELNEFEYEGAIPPELEPMMDELNKAVTSVLQRGPVVSSEADALKITLEAWESMRQSLAERISSASDELGKWLPKLRRESDATGTRLWSWFYLVSICSFAVAVLVGLVIAHLFARPVLRLARNIKETIGDERPVELRIAHPVDSLQNAVQALLAEFNDMKNDFEVSRERVAKSERFAVVGRVGMGLSQEIIKFVREAKDLLKESEMPDTVDSPSLKRVLSIVERVEELLDEFLDFGGAMKPRFALIDVNDVIQEAVNLVAHECEENAVKVELELGSFPHVLADESLFQEALVNIMHNALEAMSNGGTLSITTRLSFAGGPPPLSDNEGIEIFIADTGPGIPEDQLEHIFEPFYSTKSKGTGMGLPIVKQIVEQHGGRVRVLNREGGGVVVSIFLPLPSPEQKEHLERLEEAMVRESVGNENS